MLIIAALFLVAPPADFTGDKDPVAPPADFTVDRYSEKIDKVVWYDGSGEKHVTDQPYLQIRFTVTNKADHPLRWQGFHSARVVYGTRYVGGAVLPVRFGPGPDCRWENSLVTGSVVNPGQKTTILVVFDLPRTPGPASVRVQWKGENPGWNMTVSIGFKLKEVPNGGSPPGPLDPHSDSKSSSSKSASSSSSSSPIASS
jgi:hypothetical protein